jgi:hypothetical protein
MNIAYKALFAGMLSIVFCGTAIAHDRHDGNWSGGVSIAVTPSGHVSWGGGLNYGYAPAAVYPDRHARIIAPAGYYGPVCRHPSHRAPVAHHRGHRHHKHNKHWKKHHRAVRYYH